MIESDRTRPTGTPLASSALPLLLVLFAGSGCAALVYEIVWFQLLQLVIGSTAVSLGLVLGAFMGGMCLGSLALPRLVSARRHPLRVYALLELGIAASGILVLFGVPLAGRVYLAFAGYGFNEILLRGILASVCLLIPAALMGATLPAIARWVETTPHGVSWLGFFYGGNTVGAVGGCLLAGFYLLRLYDMATATCVAVAINLTVAIVAFALARRIPHSIAAEAPQPAKVTAHRGAWAVYVTIALSGASALGAEVIWTRLFSLMLGGTTYTFSIILAAFLTGIGIGSSVGSRALGRIARPGLALGVCQWLLVVAIAWTSLMFSNSKGYLPFAPAPSANSWITFAFDLARCAWAIVPAACLWGASFPLALAALAAPGQDGGRLVGRVYAANTVGSIVGAVASSLLLIPGIGTQQSQRLLMGVAAAAALLMLVPLVWPFRDAEPIPKPPGTVPILRSLRSKMGLSPSLQRFWNRLSAGSGPGMARRKLAGPLAIAAALVAAAFLAYGVKPVPFELIAYGREAYLIPGRGLVELYRGEGINASICVSEHQGMRQFHVSGKVEASSDLYDMRVQRMLANLPALLHPDPQAVLVVGFGAGVTAGSFLPYFDVRRLVICEIEPLIPRAIGPFFSKYNFDVLKDPTVEVFYDDARHYILSTDEKFDIITSDPIHPYVKGAASLYTQEYFAEVRAHLRPGGFAAQWVPLYESSMESVKTEIATFLQVFPHATAWCNMKGGEGYDLVLLGTAEPLTIDLDAIHERLGKYPYRFVARSLAEVHFESATALFATFAGQGPDFLPWLKDAQINRDANLRLQYLAGMVPAKDQRSSNFREMLAYRKYPENLFIGSEEHREALRKALATPAKDEKEPGE